jgi:hypothetical protein
MCAIPIEEKLRADYLERMREANRRSPEQIDRFADWLSERDTKRNERPQSYRWPE